MKRALTCLAIIAAFTVTCWGQSRSLTNTTWTLYFQECAVGGRPSPNKWEEQVNITFLPGGKINDGVWTQTGNRVHIKATALIIDLKLNANSTEMNGEGCLSMTCRENFCVRLVRQNIAPRGEPAAPAGGDGFAPFYANFKRAVLSNNRASVRDMMSPVFLWALGDEESPEKALRDMDTKEWQQLRVAVNRFPVRCKQPCFGYRGYHLDDRHLGELLFTQENGKWKWKGLLGD